VSDPWVTPSRSDFEAFFEAEHERLLRLFVVTGSAEEADELMQDAFVAGVGAMGSRRRDA
jgi:DNA-directed RNA polymerase specialized sigma24 family protein